VPTSENKFLKHSWLGHGNTSLWFSNKMHSKDYIVAYNACFYVAPHIRGHAN